jgi:hypothetical protein
MSQVIIQDREQQSPVPRGWNASAQMLPPNPSLILQGLGGNLLSQGYLQKPCLPSQVTQGLGGDLLLQGYWQPGSSPSPVTQGLWENLLLQGYSLAG